MINNIRVVTQLFHSDGTVNIHGLKNTGRRKNRWLIP